ncbi:MAG: response regulator [Myxococcota bacterium]
MTMMSKAVAMDTLNLDLPERLLIIEDDRTVRAMLRRCFEHRSHVIEASDGAEGLRLLSEARPDFVITDLILPVQDGLSFISAARRAYFGACVPILVLTSSWSESLLLECFREGADDFMVKPFSAMELRMRVSSIYLRQKVARDTNPLTGLPGNLVIKNQLQRRLVDDAPVVVAALDIDHFKAFNDSRGFDAGDEVIAAVGDILESYAYEHAEQDVFVGHVGGDDFVALLPPGEVASFGPYVHARFNHRTRAYYAPEELREGSVEIVNRRGESERVPLLSLSICAVRTRPKGIDDYRRINQVLAEVKKVAKSEPGNSVVIDDRQIS